MKKLIMILALLISSNAHSQFIEELYKDFLKYGTVYGAGDINNSIEADEFTYFVRTNPDGNLYAPPVVVDGTDYYDFDYRYGF